MFQLIPDQIHQKLSRIILKAEFWTQGYTISRVGTLRYAISSFNIFISEFSIPIKLNMLCAIKMLTLESCMYESLILTIIKVQFRRSRQSGCCSCESIWRERKIREKKNEFTPLSKQATCICRILYIQWKSNKIYKNRLKNNYRRTRWKVVTDILRKLNI